MLSDNGFDYETVFYHMTWDEILEANAAIDLQIEAQKNAEARRRAEREARRRFGRR